MQRIGRVLHISPSRNLIITTETLPRIGEKVVDENLKTVGRIFDIIGPVSSPYAVIEPLIHEPQRLVNMMLYRIPSERRKEKHR